MFREKELRLLKELEDTLNMKTACFKLGLKLSTAYQMLYRLRLRYLEARDFVNKYEHLRSKPALRKVLTPSLREIRRVKVGEER